MDSNFKIMYAMVAMLSVNIGDVAIITVKNIDYLCIIHNNSKSKAINLLENYVLEDRGYILKNIVLNFSLFKAGFFYIFCSVYIKWLIVWTSISL